MGVLRGDCSVLFLVLGLQKGDFRLNFSSSVPGSLVDLVFQRVVRCRRFRKRRFFLFKLASQTLNLGFQVALHLALLLVFESLLLFADLQVVNLQGQLLRVLLHL